MDVNNFIKDHSNEITFNKNVEMIIISYEKMQNMKSKNICNDVGIKHGSDDNNHNTHIINPCRHTMCKLCIIKCFENKLTCPICRTIKKSINTIDDEDILSTNLQNHNIKRENIVNKMF